MLNIERLKKVSQRFSTKFNINASVGDWSASSENATQDIETIQLLLEFVAAKHKRKEFDPMGVDGKISRTQGRSSTVKAILSYQKQFMKIADGRIDPNAKTHSRMWADVMLDSVSAQAVMNTPKQHDGKPPWLQQSSLVTTPNWVGIAKNELGVKEIPGKKNNQKITIYHKSVGNNKNENTAWCASFVNWVIEQAGYVGADSAWSHSWKRWGEGVSKPALGSVAFIDWGRVHPNEEEYRNKGHVGFVVGRTAGGRIVLLGGNQSNRVRYSHYKASYISAYRVPKNFVVNDSLYQLPILSVAKGGSSFNESR